MLFRNEKNTKKYVKSKGNPLLFIYIQFILKKLVKMRRSGKLLSYQVISTENCLCRTEARDVAWFSFVSQEKKHTELCGE